MRLRHSLLLALLALGTLATEAHARRFGTIEFEPCTLAPEYAAVSVEAQCGTLRVPEDRAQPAGRQIELAIAWVPTEHGTEADPVFMLAGGPGQGARDSYPMLAPAFRETLRKRHVILLDQRGTGGSNPLVCRDKEGRGAVTDSLEDTPEAAAAFARRCLQELSSRADARHYTTSVAVQDLDAVRAALGAERLNLVGISYGTRVAQQYVRAFPERVRSVVLDGVVPNALVLGSEHAKNLEAALDLQFARCTEHVACRERLGDPRVNFQRLATELRQTPRTLRYRDAFSGEERTDALTYGHLASVVRMYAYAPMAAAMLPLTLHEAAAGRAEPLMAQAQMMLGQVSEQIMHGMQLTVICSEDAAQLQADPADADSVLGNEFVVFTQAQCGVWPRGGMPDDFHAPLRSELPVLLLSGEYDPVTPPRYGEQVLQGLPQGRHLVLRGQGHNVLGVGCMPKLVARFIDTAKAAELDAGCLDRLSYAPPFVGFYGWEP
jgi:pimeloyl-ACP methyl ester carboxylesterase